MTKSPSDIDHISVSSMRLYLDCPRSWAAQYLDEIKREPGRALLKGRAVDEASTHNWRQKITSGEDLPVDEIVEFATESLYAAVDEAGGREAVDWDGSNLGATVDAVGRMTRRHAMDHAPMWTPTAVQQRAIKRLPDGRDFLGFIDAVAPEGLIDVKTGSKAMNQGDADRDLQASAYAWLTDSPGPFHFARVILTSDRAQTRSEVVTTQRTQRGIDGFAELAENVSHLIDDGVFPRTPGFHCRWCVLANTCPVGSPNV